MFFKNIFYVTGIMLCIMAGFFFMRKRFAQRQVPSDISKVTFGSVITDHMIQMEWDEQNGWSKPKIVAYAGMNFDPACIGLHYGPSIFEGMKAFKTQDGKIAMFRPMEHLSRFNRSARRMCMPEIDIKIVLQAMKKLIIRDQRWVPMQAGTSLYIRPFMFATETTINLKVANKFTFLVILSPVAGFYGTVGLKSVPILVSDHYTRASVGGVGDVKTAGNYAASMLAQQDAKKQGCAQVLWLDPVERKYVEEVGSMNIFFVKNGQLITPSLSGTILPGITRKSIIELSSKLGIKVIERRISIDEVVRGIEKGEITEVFGTGTAAVIAPVGILHYKNLEYVINNNLPGSIAQQMFDELGALAHGCKHAEFDWLEYV